ARKISRLEIDPLIEVRRGKITERPRIELECLLKSQVREELLVVAEDLERRGADRTLVDDMDRRAFDPFFLFESDADRALVPGEEILLVGARGVMDDLRALEALEIRWVLAAGQVGRVSRHRQGAPC